MVAKRPREGRLGPISVGSVSGRGRVPTVLAAVPPTDMNAKFRFRDVLPLRLLVVLSFALVGFLPAVSGASSPVVSKVRAVPRSGSQVVDITYDLADADSARLTVSVAVSDNGGATFAVPATSLNGDGYGSGVAPGKGKRIAWDAGRDWANRFSANMRFRVTASDSGEPPNPDLARLVWIPAGTFTMGSPAKEVDRWSYEGPQTVVTLSRGFWLGKYEVTQREYLAVVGTNPSYFEGDLDRPVEQVSWNSATDYCGRLTARERAAGRLPAGYEYRLPTEAQWEYACRAGTTTATAFGNSLSSTQANFAGDYPYNGGAKGPYLGRTTKVGSYAPNAWGLYDLHGNVLEWCLDWWSDALPGGGVTDPKGPNAGSARVLRGGGWFDSGLLCRSAFRYGGDPDARGSYLGFRAALVAVP
jgi:sulfatase modifying factor 1